MTFSLFFWLALSFLCSNFTNSALLYLQRHERKARISYHAASSRKAYVLYSVGHLFGGAFFIIFSYKLFETIHHSPIVFTLCLFGAVLEWLQALVPSWRELKTPHWLFAWGAGVVMLGIMLSAPFAVGIHNGGQTALYFAIFALILNTCIDIKVTRKRFWLTQSTYSIFFYITMLLLIR